MNDEIEEFERNLKIIQESEYGNPKAPRPKTVDDILGKTPKEFVIEIRVNRIRKIFN